MHRLLTRVLAAVVIWQSPAVLMASEVVQTTITVRLYQTADLSSSLEDRALAEAESILRAAFVNVRWRKCTGPDRERTGACDSPLAPSERELRILRQGAVRDDASFALGDALVERSAGGVLATVYFDRVAWLANAAHTDVAVVLGRTAAHELAHLLMRTAGHAGRGLMRPRWTPGEIRRNHAVDWAFTAGDIVAMRWSADASHGRRAGWKDAIDVLEQCLD
jgi:hypothetical protein